MRNLLLSFCILIISASLLQSQSRFDTEKFKKHEGYFTFYYSESDSKIFLEVDKLDSEFLYLSSLSQGVGNNDLGLDRGQLGDTRVVKFIKSGNRLLLIQNNLMYRAITDNELERKSVEEAFAKSVIYGFKIFEQKDGKYIIDLTAFLMQDTHGVTETLKNKNQGEYKLDLSRSALNMDRTKAFPKNVEFDVLITLKGNAKAYQIQSVTPDPNLVSVYQHHSFIELPDNEFIKREYHPNSAAYTNSYFDYSSPVGSEMKKEFCNRHRLEKKDPNAAISEAKEPIIYYLDNGTPEPIRSALLEGASWWNEAFEEIGYKDAFQVQILPDNADPLDIRYNVIQWVHRSTRGWSYGMTVEDPRTGEIIKGHVSLGSLRVRQDYLIAQALTKDPFNANNDQSDKLLNFALARIRQLSAHEVGHTLGLKHNFAASMKDRSSVMDYPHPLVKIVDNEIDLSDAYDNGIGEWDKVTIAYLYSDEGTDLKKVLSDAMDDGHRFITDDDARPLGSASIHGHLWDNGTNSIDELNRLIEVRNKAIDQFDEKNISQDGSYEDLEDAFVLLYFFHRYQVEAAIKSIAGLDYSHALKDETDSPSEVLEAAEQRRALQSILKTLSANFLHIPAEKRRLFPVRPGGNRDRESFSTKTGPVFDPISAANTAADFVLNGLLHPERANRLVIQKSQDRGQLGLEELLNELISSSILTEHVSEELELIQSSINQAVVVRLFGLAQSKECLLQTKAIINNRLRKLHNEIQRKPNRSIQQSEISRMIDYYFEHPESVPALRTSKIPDGSPIGSHSCSHG